MSDERWSVRVSKDYTVFAAAHFITYGGGQCERIHGHNYRVCAELWGPLDENAYVFDFIALKDVLREIVAELDHRLILPGKSSLIRVEEREGEVWAVYEDRRWVVPAQDCVILPIANTTAELLGAWIAQQLVAKLQQRHGYRPQRVAVEVEESPGQRARYELALDRSFLESDPQAP